MVKSRRVLLVMSPHSRGDLSLIEKARRLYEEDNIELHLLYVIPRIPAQFYQVESVKLWEKRQRKIGRLLLDQIAQAFEVKSHCRWLRAGNVANEAENLANTIHIDEVIGECSDRIVTKHKFLHAIATPFHAATRAMNRSSHVLRKDNFLL